MAIYLVNEQYNTLKPQSYEHFGIRDTYKGSREGYSHFRGLFVMQRYTWTGKYFCICYFWAIDLGYEQYNTVKPQSQGKLMNTLVSGIHKGSHKGCSHFSGLLIFS